MKKYLFMAAVLALFIGCKSKSSTTGPSADIHSTITAGWQAFAVADWANAITLFGSAVQTDPSSSEGWIGLGWSEARSNTHQWQNAINDLNRAVVLSRYSTDARAGLAFAYYGARTFTSSDTANADSAATFVIDRSTIWIFSHDESITIQDLHALRASCRYNVGNFTAALTALQEIDPEFNVDVTTAVGQAALAEQIGRWLER